ncbi:non-ribosomal peptide synthetase, partial [Spongiactinospora sp. TRM90649]|uniref:non-ribosomal peptide synthetase n=1 Tax=Spongiactinospora sp. TRM90649 TaxID=3031114 RepID=UPI0023F95517
MFPLSYAQRRLWFLDRLEGGTSYNVPLHTRVLGRLNVPALTRALGDVLERHEPLRTLIRDADGEPFQHILPPEQARALLVVDHRRQPPGHDLAAEAAAHRFDLAAELPIRVTLIDQGPGTWLLVIVLHHVAADGWSMRPLAQDLSAAYHARTTTGAPPTWAPLPITYTDFTLWQQDVLDQDGPHHLEHWRAALAGMPHQITLPADRPRPAVQTQHGHTLTLPLDPELYAAMRQAARTHDVTVFMVLHAALATVLHRLGAGTDIPIGTVTAQRTHEHLEDLVGFFVNTLILRTDLAGDPTFTALLDRVRQTDLIAYDHTDLPFDRLVEDLQPARTLTHHPLIQVLAVAEDIEEIPLLQGEGLTSEMLQPPTTTARFDLSVGLEQRTDPRTGQTRAQLAVGYATDLFDQETAAALGHRVLAVLRQVTADPQVRISALDVLVDGERGALTGHWARGADATSATLPQLFARQVRRDPAAPAVEDGPLRWSYAELDERSDRLAAFLAAAGVGPDRCVAVSMDRSADLALSLLAVAKAGGVYVPIDPELPAARKRLILTETDPVLALVDTRDRLTGTTPVRQVLVAETDLGESAPSAPVTAPALDNGAYVIYTSGSTGTPKGVMLPHAGLGRLTAQFATYGVTPGSRILQVASISFDGSVWEMVMALLMGGTLVVGDPGDLLAGRSPGQVSHVTLTPSLLMTLRDGILPPGMTIITASEAAGESLLARWSGEHTIVNSYGPTETTVCATGGRLEAGGPVTIGRPVAGTDVFVLDEYLQPVPAGVAGELYATGSGLARGYLGSPTTTAERFTAGPYGPPGTRMYRTGDLARWNHDGTLEFLGRTDDQVKIRGFRIEPGEVESALLAHSGIERAAVVVREDTPGDRRLVGYVVPASGDPIDTEAVKAGLAATLPAYMVPALVVIDGLPITVNGKLDRAALPAPAVRAGASRAASTPREELLCTIFAEVLGSPEVGADDDFFELGGHSLLAVRAVNRVQTALGHPVPLRALFDAPTPARLAAHLDEAAQTRLPALARRPRPASVPVSPAQRRLWFLHRLDDGATYNVPLHTRLHGPLDADALRAAFGDLIERHEPLRTLFRETDGEPFQQPLTPDEARALLVIDENPEPEGHRFDLAEELPIRVSLTRDSGAWLLVIVLHHIAADGWSMRPLAQDLSAAYAARVGGAAPDWEPLPITYTDYTLWQYDVLGQDAQRHLEHWRTALAGMPHQIALPADRARPAVPTHHGRTLTLQLDAESHAALRQAARTHDVTVFMVLHAALATVLHRLGAGTDIPIGTVTAQRTHEHLEDLVGFFVNTLILRTDLAGDPTFTALLHRVRQTDLTAYDHTDLPFDRLVEDLQPARTLTHHPLIQVTIGMADGVDRALALPGLDCADESAEPDVAQFDLDFTFAERLTEDGAPAGVTLWLGYATDLFDEATARRLGETLIGLLGRALADPGTPIGRIEIMPPAERDRMLAAGRSAVPSRPGRSLIEAFEEQVRRTPGAPAIIEGTARLSYRELSERADRAASALLRAGVAPDAPVPILMERSTELVVAFLGVLKAGAAYLPLDSAHPAARLREIADGVSCPVLLIDEAYRDHELAVRQAAAGRRVLVMPADAATAPVSRPAVHPAQTAYVMFTSGSTGTPKGIAVSHGNVADLALDPCWEIGPGDRVLFHASHAFDASTYEIWAPLLNGGTVVVAPPGKLDAGSLGSLIRRHAITRISMTAGLFRVVAADLADTLASVDEVTTGGDVIAPEAVARVIERCPRTIVRTTYGPTEMTLCVTQTPYRSGDRVGDTVPLGTPLDGTRLYVLDEYLQPVPAGVAGELYAAGAGLARGYLGSPATTAERFTAGPYGPPGSRMYRTGDLARWNHDGTLEFLGRTDDQVKIRGYRIEPGEIQAAIAALPGVRQNAVVVREDTPGDKRLVAYLVPEPGDPLDAAAVKARLGAALPAYMVPALVVIDRLPITVNGKLDRAAL